MLENFKDKKILILGFGREGMDTFKFLRKIFPDKVLGVGDQQKNLKFKIKNLKLIRWHLGNNYLKAVKDYDIIIKSPGVPIHLPEIEKAYKERKITSQAEIFLENCPGKIIGIAGTKGKGNTALLIYRILKEAGFKTHLIGNIGKPVLNFLFSATKKDIYVYEISSHQLYNLKKSIPIAVFLNIYSDHLDFFKNFKEYVRAEANIALNQTKDDFLIYNSKNKIVREIAKKSKAIKIPIPTNYPGPSRSGRTDLGRIFTNIQISLIGGVNLQNIMAAVTIGRIFEISDKKIIRAIKKFKPLPHRLEYVGTFQGIKFYDDSASTIPEATIFALTHLGKNVQTILLGGSEKEANFKKLAKEILKSKPRNTTSDALRVKSPKASEVNIRGKIKNLILFPTTGEKIWREIAKLNGGQTSVNLPRNFFVNNMTEAVKLAYQHTKKGKICLLSPASASFSLFKDYEERGNLFKKQVFAQAKTQLKMKR